MFHIRNRLSTLARTKWQSTFIQSNRKNQFLGFIRDETIAPKLPVLEATMERILEAGGFSNSFKQNVVMSMVFHGYGTNASLLHAILDLGFPAHLLYVASKPHTTDEHVRKYLNSMGVRYIDFANYHYVFDDFPEKSFPAGTYPAGYYYEAISQYYAKVVEAQCEDLLWKKRYPEVNCLALLDEGGKYHLEFDREKHRFSGYKIVALGHSTSDLVSEANEKLTYPKISMGGAALKTQVESKEIANSNLASIDELLTELPDEIQRELCYGVLGCGNVGSSTIQSLIAQGRRVIYFDLNANQYTHINSLIQAAPLQLTQANSVHNLLENSDVIFSCVGKDMSEYIIPSALGIRKDSPLQKKMMFNFASGEKEFMQLIRLSQDKNNPRIVNPKTRNFPDCELSIANEGKLIIKFSGMPANMMSKKTSALPPEKAQFIRAMKLAAIYQMDLLQQLIKFPVNYYKNYIQLDAWWQRFILKEYLNDLSRINPRNKEMYETLMAKFTIQELERLSNGIPQTMIDTLVTVIEHAKIIDSIMHNSFYVERKLLTAEIDDCFLQPKNHRLSFTLYGLGGAGKTQIAQQYFITNCQKYTLALYFNAESTLELVEQYKNKLRKYNHQTRFGHGQDVIQDFIAWVEKHPSALLIYDNVEDYQAIENMLPNIGRQRILITTRAEDGFHRSEVCSMTKDESEALLLGILKREAYKNNDLDKVPELTSELYHFPLAIAQAGAVITAKDESYTVTQYLNSFKENRRIFLGSKIALPWKAGSHDSVYVTWLMIKEKLTKTSLPWEYVLQVMSVLPPDTISSHTVKTEVEKLIDLRGGNEDKFWFHSYIGACALFLYSQSSAATEIDALYMISVFMLIKKLFLIYQEKEVLHLKNRLPLSLEKLKELGVIKKVDNSHYCIHRLMQEILIFDLNKLNFKSKISLLEALSKEINTAYSQKFSLEPDLAALARNAQSLLKITSEVLSILKNNNDHFHDEYYITSKTGTTANDEYFLIQEGLMGNYFYENVLKNYLSIEFQLIRILIDLKHYAACRSHLEEIKKILSIFNGNLIYSDKLQFYSYNLKINDYIALIEGYLFNLSKEGNSFEMHHEIIYDLLCLEKIPTFEKNSQYSLPLLEKDLGEYIDQQREILASIPLYAYYEKRQINKKIEAANWLIKNCPLSTKIEKFTVYQHNLIDEDERYIYSFPARNVHMPKLLSGKLNQIVKMHYPLILIEDPDEILKASEKWWLKQETAYENAACESDSECSHHRSPCPD